MNIAFVAPFGLGQKTTVWARTLPLARTLVDLGHSVSITIPPWDTPADAGKRWADHGVAMANVSLRGGLPFVVRRMLAEVTQHQPDIVQIVKPRAHAGMVQWWLWQMRKLNAPAVRIVLDIDDWEQAWAAINRYPLLTARFLAWQEEWGIRHADGISAASRWLEQRAHQIAPATPVLYLPNGVDEALLSKSLTMRLPPSSPTILFFTRYVEVEPGWLAEFASYLYAKKNQLRLVVAGQPLRPDGDSAFRRAVSAANPALTERVEWRGRVTPQGIESLYASATCAIFPAAPTVLQMAKCSVRLATTLLHGVPVVASAVGEQANFGAEGAARLVAADATPVEFADALLDLLDHPAQQREMIARAQQRLAQHYRWVQLGERLEEFYRSD